MFSGDIMHAIKKLVVEADCPFQILNIKSTSALFLLGSWNKDSLEFNYWLDCYIINYSNSNPISFIWIIFLITIKIIRQIIDKINSMHNASFFNFLLGHFSFGERGDIIIGRGGCITEIVLSKAGVLFVIFILPSTFTHKYMPIKFLGCEACGLKPDVKTSKASAIDSSYTKGSPNMVKLRLSNSGNSMTTNG